MVSKFFDKLKKKKEDNQGAAIVIVIVAIAFIGMLIAMLVYMTYYNYLMKHIDRSAKDNFYSAEYALEIINAGLQKDIFTDSADTMQIQATEKKIMIPIFLYWMENVFRQTTFIFRSKATLLRTLYL